jgi:hypothetical protein
MQQHKKINYIDNLYKLIYICIDDVIDETVLDVGDFKHEYNISTKNFKFVEDKIYFHHLFLNILKVLRENSLENSYKPVLYISYEKIATKNIKLPIILKQIKVLKSLLPIPLIIPIKTLLFSSKSEGKIKELNLKCSEFYSKRKIKLAKLKKYLDTKGYTTLNNSLSSIVNLKGVYY